MSAGKSFWIQVVDYREFFGGTKETHEEWTNIINKIVNEEFKTAEVKEIFFYSMNNERINYNVGEVGKKLAVFGGASFDKHPENAIEIKSEEGECLATYAPEKEQLTINSDMFSKEVTKEAENLLRFIMSQMEKLVWEPIYLQDSWVHTRDKKALSKRLIEDTKALRFKEIEYSKKQLVESEQIIKEQRERLKKTIDNLYTLRRQIAVEEENINTVGEKMIKELELIANHRKVVDLRIKNDIYEVFTDDIYCYTDEDKRYYIGKMKFTMNLKNTDMRFFNLNNPRKGYWTDKDPHPHVNGRNGEACLGNVSTTIAELCARNELYALALTCIDFLENVNTHDPAGAKVTHWDEVDLDGDIIQEGRIVEYWNCDACGNEYEEGDGQYTAYDEVDGDGDLCSEVVICEDCRCEYYHYSDYFDAYVADNICDPEDTEEEDF